MWKCFDCESTAEPERHFKGSLWILGILLLFVILLFVQSTESGLIALLPFLGYLVYYFLSGYNLCSNCGSKRVKFTL
jgi:hypothetical protein